MLQKRRKFENDELKELQFYISDRILGTLSDFLCMVYGV